jgi:hypothetical protein
MRFAKPLTFASLASLALTLPGCIIVAETDRIEYPERVVTDPTSANWASIRAARGIRSSADRSAALIAVAQREDLSQADQFALVEAATEGNMYSSATSDVMLAIVNNPKTTIETRNNLAANLRRANLASSDRKRVTDAMIATTPAAPPAQ